MNALRELLFFSTKKSYPASTTLTRLPVVCERHVCEVADAAKQANLDAAQEGDRHHNQTVRQRYGQESEPGQDGRLARHRPSERLRHHFVDSTDLTHHLLTHHLPPDEDKEPLAIRYRRWLVIASVSPFLLRACSYCALVSNRRSCTTGT
jgi:hypothetical protein